MNKQFVDDTKTNPQHTCGHRGFHINKQKVFTRMVHQQRTKCTKININAKKQKTKRWKYAQIGEQMNK